MTLATDWTYHEEAIKLKSGTVTECRAISPDGTQRTRWKSGNRERTARQWAMHDVQHGRLQELSGGVWTEDYRRFGKG